MKNPPLASASVERNQGAFRIAGIYLALGALWILFSDQVAAALTNDPSILTTVSILKGWGYILVTTLLLYWLIRRHTAALRESEQWLRAIIDNATGIVWVKDLQGRFLIVNRYHEEVLGLTQKQIVGKTVFDIHPLELAQAYTANDRQVLESGKTLEFEETTPLQDGEHTYVSVKFPMRDTYGRIVALGAICTDITGRKRIEEELRHTADELARSNVELEQFAYVASHDLQEPLRVIAGMVQLLQQRYQGKLDARADEFIAHILDGTVRMQTLIDDLLVYSRVGRQGKPFTPTDTSAPLQDALANLAATIQESGAVITHDTLPVVIADPTQLVQLFQNLVGNALKFRSQRPPEIHIGVERLPAEWRFAVCDNGIGIEPQYFERIFTVFQRLHTRREFPGTGIGLAICKKIVERHGGQIWVDSQPGQGSTFYFTIPYREQHGKNIR
jgi:PAS domain S-box-containing protein